MLIFVIIGSLFLLILQICLCVLLKKYKLPYLLPSLWFLAVIIISFLGIEMICKSVSGDTGVGRGMYEVVAEIQWLPTLKPVFVNAVISVIPFLVTTFLRRIKGNEKYIGISKY